MIQEVVSRMANATAHIKRLCLIIIAAAVAFAASTGSAAIPIYAIGLIVIFCGLDARYLQQENWYRDIYDQVRLESPETPPDFRLTANSETKKRHLFFSSFSSWSTRVFYPLIILFLIIIWLALK